MQQLLFTRYLEEMVQKYSIASWVRVVYERSAILISSDSGEFRFHYDFDKEPPQDKWENVPLLHWRKKRRYVELGNVLSQGLVETPLAMRIQHIVARDEFVRTLTDILFMEVDLIQWLFRQTVGKVFVSMSADYLNGIFSTDGGIKVSAELGILIDGSEPALLHELICKTGIISDMAVDTQTQQYPIYVFNGSETKVFSDIDFELFGLTQSECDALRFILWALKDSSHREQARESSIKCFAVISAAHQAARNTSYTSVIGGDF